MKHDMRHSSRRKFVHDVGLTALGVTLFSSFCKGSNATEDPLQRIKKANNLIFMSSVLFIASDFTPAVWKRLTIGGHLLSLLGHSPATHKSPEAALASRARQ